MSKYFNARDKFDFHLFMADLLDGIDIAVQTVFGGKSTYQNEGILSRVTPNVKYSCKKCRKLSSTTNQSQLFTQCKSCIVATSQTKMGACLQLKWSKYTRLTDVFNLESCYVSIDLVPAMFIEQIMTAPRTWCHRTDSTNHISQTL